MTPGDPEPGPIDPIILGCAETMWMLWHADEPDLPSEWVRVDDSEPGFKVIPLC
jgi:hypothetical protein